MRPPRSWKYSPIHDAYYGQVFYAAPYARGFRYCVRCRYWFVAGRVCPFCGKALRLNPHDNRSRKRIADSKPRIDPADYGIDVSET